MTVWCSALVARLAGLSTMSCRESLGASGGEVPAEFPWSKRHKERGMMPLWRDLTDVAGSSIVIVFLPAATATH